MGSSGTFKVRDVPVELVSADDDSALSSAQAARRLQSLIHEDSMAGGEEVRLQDATRIFTVLPSPVYPAVTH